MSFLYSLFGIGYDKAGYDKEGYSAGFPVMPRKQEVFAAWNRFRKLEVND